MNADEHGLRHEELTHRITGCAMEVLNGLGHGFHEKPYENALVIEFENAGIAYAQQPPFDLVYKGKKVGRYVPDLIANEQVIVDAKVIDRIGDYEIGQMLNDLKTTGCRVGLVINFKRARLEWKRVVNDAYPCASASIRGSKTTNPETHGDSQ